MLRNGARFVEKVARSSGYANDY